MTLGEEARALAQAAERLAERYLRKRAMLLAVAAEYDHAVKNVVEAAERILREDCTE